MVQDSLKKFGGNLLQTAIPLNKTQALSLQASLMKKYKASTQAAWNLKEVSEDLVLITFGYDENDEEDDNHVEFGVFDIKYMEGHKSPFPTCTR